MGRGVSWPLPVTALIGLPAQACRRKGEGPGAQWGEGPGLLVVSVERAKGKRPAGGRPFFLGGGAPSDRQSLRASMSFTISSALGSSVGKSSAGSCPE